MEVLQGRFDMCWYFSIISSNKLRKQSIHLKRHVGAYMCVPNIFYKTLYNTPFISFKLPKDYQDFISYTSNTVNTSIFTIVQYSTVIGLVNIIERANKFISFLPVHLLLQYMFLVIIHKKQSVTICYTYLNFVNVIKRTWRRSITCFSARSISTP